MCPYRTSVAAGRPGQRDAPGLENVAQCALHGEARIQFHHEDGNFLPVHKSVLACCVSGSRKAHAKHRPGGAAARI
jgi:hypothetical protein